MHLCTYALLTFTIFIFIHHLLFLYIIKKMTKEISKLKLGIRNCNPGNIVRNEQNDWKGLRPVQKDKKFCQFTEMKWGIRALLVTLNTYVVKHKLVTVDKIINRWAPPNDDNNTVAYISFVAGEVGKKVTNSSDRQEQLRWGLAYKFSDLDWEWREYNYSSPLFALVKAICKMESGYQLTYDEFEEGLKSV